MIRLIAEGWQGMQGALRILTFRAGGEAMFDVSLAGFWRSFAAALFVIPLVTLIHFERLHLGVGIDAAMYSLIFAATWLSFPLAAALAVAVIGAKPRYLAWVILHNWGVVWLYLVITAIWSLQVAGIINGEFRDFLFYLYAYYLRVLVHWRLAYVALGVPTITSAVAAIVPILVSQIILVAISQAFASAATAAS